MKKALICYLSAALLLASLAACGSPKADQPSEPDPTPSSVQTEAPSMEPSETVSAQNTDAPTETITVESSPVVEASAEPSTSVPATEPPTPTAAVPASSAPVITEPPAPATTVPASVAPVVTELPVSTQPTTEDNGTSNEHIGEDGMFHADNYVGEIPGMVYVYPFGYYPEGGNVQIIDGNMPNWNDVVGGD